jgi:hypothetical protein
MNTNGFSKRQFWMKRRTWRRVKRLIPGDLHVRSVRVHRDRSFEMNVEFIGMQFVLEFPRWNIIERFEILRHDWFRAGNATVEHMAEVAGLFVASKLAETSMTRALMGPPLTNRELQEQVIAKADLRRRHHELDAKRDIKMRRERERRIRLLRKWEAMGIERRVIQRPKTLMEALGIDPRSVGFDGSEKVGPCGAGVMV